MLDIVTTSETQLVKTIKAHIAAGDKAKDKADQHYISAGQHLQTLKAQAGDWAEWEAILKTKLMLSTGRASELMQIADGRKSLAEVREGKADSMRRSRASSPRGEETNDDIPPFLDRAEAPEYPRDYQSPWEAHGTSAGGDTAPPPDMPTQEEADESYQETLYDHACLIVDEKMSGATRQRFFAHLKRLYHANYSQSPSQSGDKGLSA